MRYSLIGSLVAVFVIQLCLGSTYAWSTFVEPLKRDCNISPMSAQFIFGIRTLVFTLTMLAAGSILNRVGYRKIALLSSLIYAAGHIIPMFFPASFVAAFLGLAVLTGCGMGGGYLVAIRYCAGVLPEHKGLLIGVGVGFFGGGAILAGKIATFFLAENYHVTSVFAILGLIYGISCFLAAFFLPETSIQPSNLIEKSYAFSSTHFWFAIFACFTAKLSTNIAGLLIIGNIMALANAFALDSSIGVLGIAYFSIGNITGRLMWGWLYDKIGLKTILLALLGFATLLASYRFFVFDAFHFHILIFSIGFFFGSAFVLYASFLADIYGPTAIQSAYPFVFLAHGLGAIFGPVAGAAVLSSGVNISTLFFSSAAILLLGFLFFCFFAHKSLELLFSGKVKILSLKNNPNLLSLNLRSSSE